MYRRLQGLEMCQHCLRVPAEERREGSHMGVVRSSGKLVDRLGRATYVDILGQKLIRYAVLVDDIVVHASASTGGSQQEAE